MMTLHNKPRCTLGKNFCTQQGEDWRLVAVLPGILIVDCQACLNPALTPSLPHSHRWRAPLRSVRDAPDRRAAYSRRLSHAVLGCPRRKCQLTV